MERDFTKNQSQYLIKSKKLLKNYFNQKKRVNKMKHLKRSKMMLISSGLKKILLS